MLKIILVMSILFALMGCTGNTIKRQALPTKATKPQIDCQKLLKNKALRSKKAQIYRKRQTVKKPISQKLAKKKINTTKKSPLPSKTKRRRLTVETLKRQIAQLSEPIRYSEQGSEKTNIIKKIKFVNDFHIHKSHLAIQYAKEWEHEIECTGNLNFPESARKKDLELRMNVAINENGSIYSMRITEPSGVKLVDEAAIRIVRSSAPFAPLPKELLQELNILVIPRIWKFYGGTD